MYLSLFMRTPHTVAGKRTEISLHTGMGKMHHTNRWKKTSSGSQIWK